MCLEIFPVLLLVLDLQLIGLELALELHDRGGCTALQAFRCGEVNWILCLAGALIGRDFCVILLSQRLSLGDLILQRHHVWMARGPLQGLLSAHRIPCDQRHSADAEYLSDQPVRRGGVDM